MSEIVLSTTPNHYDYSMVNINPELVNKNSNDNDSTIENNTQHPPYNSYPAYTFQQLPMGFTPVSTYPQSTMSRMDYFNEPTTTSTSRQPNSPESVSSSSSPTPSPPPTSSSINNISLGQVIAPTQVMDTELITPLVPANQNKFNNPTTARVKEMITRATSVPMEFYHTEFLEYSKESYEKKTGPKRNKRKRTDQSDSQSNNKRKKADTYSDDDLDEENELEDKSDIRQMNNMSDAEIRRQIHIQSEQKRRAQIKDGFDELRKHLPGCTNKKMSKAALLTRTVQQLQHLKSMQNELLSEVERLLQENESLKKFQHSVLQRQAMEKMYTF